MRETLRLGFILLAITVTCATILAFSNEITSVKIEEADKLANEQARIDVLPDANQFELLEEGKMNEITSSFSNVIEIFKGYDGEELVGYTVKVKVKGYGDDIEFMSGISTEGNITGMEVLNHTETPGLGANIDKEYFTESFEGKSLEDQIVAADNPEGESQIQALTSATITTDAIVEGINIIREIYNSNLSN